MVSTDTLKEEASASSFAQPEIEVLVAGIAFGPFTEPKLRERLDEGLVALNDKARLVNSETWISLEEVLARLPVETAPAPEEKAPEPEPVPAPEDKAEEADKAQPPEAKTEPPPSPPESPSAETSSAPPPSPSPEAITPSEPAPPEGALPEPAPPVSDVPPPPPPQPKFGLKVARPEFAPAPPQKPTLGKFIGEKTGGLKRLATGPLPASPRTSSLSKPGLKSGTLLGPTPPAAGPARGLRSQIMARTSQEPLKKPSAPSRGEPISSGTLRLPPRTTTGPLSIPKPAASEPAAPKMAPPEPTLNKIAPPQPPAKPGQVDPAPVFRLRTLRPSTTDEPERDSSPTEEPTPLPEEKITPPQEAISLPSPDSASPKSDLPETKTDKDEPEKTEPGEPGKTAPEEPVHASPATRSVSVASLASATLPMPPAPPAILPARPAAERPAVDPDSVITAHIPARRTQMIKMLPGQAVRASQKLPILR